METAIFILDDIVFHVVYPPEIYQRIQERVTVIEPVYTAQSIHDNLSLLEDVTIIFSGWGGPHMDAHFLQHAPNLKAVFYGAGSIRQLVTPDFWQRNIQISSAFAINSQPVSYFTFAQIIFALKGGWHTICLPERYNKVEHVFAFPGIRGGTVGIISLGAIGRRVCELLQPLDLKLLIYDPYISEEQAASVGGELCNLETLFRESDVVSLHTPLLDETRGMLTGGHFKLMKPNSTFINTARGAVIKEDDLIEVLQNRHDLVALLDVTDPEPPAPDSPLRTLPNAVLTPHIAGACSPGEIREFGVTMVQELDRYLEGKPLEWGVTQARFEHMA